MFKKTILSAITVVLLAIALVAGAQSADHQVGHLVEESFDPALAVEADTARWVAMGEFYAGLDGTESSDWAQAAEADAARWVAMGEFYAGLAEAQRERATEEGAAR